MGEGLEGPLSGLADTGLSRRWRSSVPEASGTPRGHSQQVFVWKNRSGCRQEGPRKPGVMKALFLVMHVVVAQVCDVHTSD